MDEPGRDRPVLDLAQLADQTFGDGDLARDVLLLFEEQCDALGPIVADSAAPAQRAIALHTLKGAAAAIGALRLADRIERFEAAHDAGTEERALGEVLGAIAEAHAASAGHRRTL